MTVSWIMRFEIPRFKNAERVRRSRNSSLNIKTMFYFQEPCVFWRSTMKSLWIFFFYQAFTFISSTSLPISPKQAPKKNPDYAAWVNSKKIKICAWKSPNLFFFSGFHIHVFNPNSHIPETSSTKNSWLYPAWVNTHSTIPYIHSIILTSSFS